MSPCEEGTEYQWVEIGVVAGPPHNLTLSPLYPGIKGPVTNFLYSSGRTSFYTGLMVADYNSPWRRKLIPLADCGTEQIVKLGAVFLQSQILKQNPDKSLKSSSLLLVFTVATSYSFYNALLYIH